jgi:hypothetical protein
VFAVCERIVLIFRIGGSSRIPRRDLASVNRELQRRACQSAARNAIFAREIEIDSALRLSIES